ncbi:LapA family protein [Oscillatoria sp. FACHB-1407]|uniref:lipopolysaccharide assembly protein LapA domain-containing protein n=1 Tax=Oscillatoria sp. FACHB-1407 TaxID=2692847 RepID=UPI001686B1E3|nr:LapA family protein [Oscillatoria sp. FACHB-1407]MBD2460399.1 LapA family protein [Oscillatoria sp. FACHB-1407]
MANFIVSIIIAFWIMAIALISVQNAAPVTLRFLTFQSVQMPLGIVVAFGAAIGTVGMALILPSLKPSRSAAREDFED